MGAQLIRGHPLVKGLVGAWLFNEGSGLKTFDLSGNGNHGTFGAGAAAPTWKPSRTGIALDFDGGDYIDCNNTASLNISDEITIEVGVKLNNYLFNGIIISKYQGSNVGYYFSQDSVSPYKKILFKYGNGIASRELRTTTELNLNEWYHIVVSHNPLGDDVIYLNGIFDNSRVANDENIDSTANFLIGKYTTAYINGTIDKIGIYNRELNANETGQLYANPYSMFAQPMKAELMYAPPPVGVVSPYYYETLMAGAVV